MARYGRPCVDVECRTGMKKKSCIDSSLGHVCDKGFYSVVIPITITEK